MSRLVDMSKKTSTELETISKELLVEQAPSKYAYSQKPMIVCLYDTQGVNLYVPFAYNRMMPRPERSAFRSINLQFSKPLRDEQKVVKDEAIELLNKNGSAIISAYCGFGKCLGKDTGVMMYDGTIKKVQEIRVNEQLMGDDSTPRTVLSTCIGNERMYEICPSQPQYEKWKCNASHILSLKIKPNFDIDWVDGMYQTENLSPETFRFETARFKTRDEAMKRNAEYSEQIIEISVEEYLILPREVRRNLVLYRVGVDFALCENVYSSRKTRMNYLHRLLGKFETQSVVYVSEDANFRKDLIRIIRSLGMTAYEVGCEVRINEIQPESEFDFIAISVPERTFYGFELDGNRRFLLSDFTVTHNTALAIYIATKIRLPTLFLCHRIVLLNQWKESIKLFCPSATVKTITAQQTELEPADFYVANATTIPKHNRNFFKQIGLVCVDECHIIMAENMSKCMRYLVPRYVLGLSATPYRQDGLDRLLELYFGTEKIVRKLFRKHTVYKVNTNFIPEVKTNRMGKVDWGSVIESQSKDDERNDLIVRIIRAFPTRIFLVLCKRVDQANTLVSKLLAQGETVSSLIGDQQEYDNTSRVLVGTVQKVGVGFDHPKLNTLLLASDVESYFIQYLGRVFRTREGDPVVFDLVDKNGILEKHFKTRCQIYIEHGGEIKPYQHS